MFMKEFEEQNKIMTAFHDQVENQNTMHSEVAELLFSKPLIKLYHSLSTILTEN
jgi:hypothetical protein